MYSVIAIENQANTMKMKREKKTSSCTTIEQNSITLDSDRNVLMMFEMVNRTKRIKKKSTSITFRESSSLRQQFE